MSALHTQGHDAPLRVVLAGRTGLEGVLRRDPGFDLCRAASAMDAIGEAAEVGEARGPVCAILVGESLDRGLDDGGGERAGFIAGLKHAAPGVKVIRVSTDGCAGAYDGCLTGDESSRDVALAISRAGRVEGAAPQDEPARRSVAPDEPTSGGQRGASSVGAGSVGADPVGVSPVGAVGDEQLIAHLTRGHDIVPVAIDLVRQRLDDPTVVFEQTRGEGAGGAGVACPVVTTQGVQLGYLVSTRMSPRTSHGEGLEPHAKWLAGWLVLARQLAQLRQQAFTDHLTGAWNRRFFDRYMAGAVERARRDRRDLTLLVFDLDDFKPFNDRFGHAAGDLILTETVRLLRSVIRPSDKVARIGGDEFVVIFDDPAGPRDPGSRHPISVRQIAQRFQGQIREHKFPSLGIDAPGSLSVSGGIATFPWDGQTPEELLHRADERALESKRSGKNIITIGPDAPDTTE